MVSDDLGVLAAIAAEPAAAPPPRSSAISMSPASRHIIWERTGRRRRVPALGGSTEGARLALVTSVHSGTLTATSQADDRGKLASPDQASYEGNLRAGRMSRPAARLIPPADPKRLVVVARRQRRDDEMPVDRAVRAGIADEMAVN